ncbi:MAG: LamG-like jellyroll fold domain-containing protein [Planctomycetota bacterium]
MNPSVELKLSWLPGLYVTDHQVYFGTDTDKLSQLAQVTSPNYTVPSALMPDTTYYWRVDEIQSDGSVTASDIWNFTTGKPIGWWAWWTFDETSGSTAGDSSGNGHDATLNNMDDSDWVDGALEFDGVDDYVSIPALNSHSNTVTISAWIKRDGEQAGSDTGIVFSRDGSTTAGLCLGHGGGWTVNHHLGYNWNDRQAAWNWDSGLVVPDNEWVFVALVVESTKATLYLGQDGTLSSATNEINHNTEEFDGVTRIGHDYQPASPREQRHWKGLIDEVRIYNSALSQAEVEALYEEGLAVPE